MIIRFPHIHNGYRDNYTYISCLWSLFQWHNETLNIWTMICSLCLGAHLYIYYLNFSENRLALTAFFLGQLIHNPVSICYHLFMPVSHVLLRKLDRAAIVFMNICATWAVLYAMFNEYANVITVILSVISIRLLAKTWNIRTSDRITLLDPILTSALGYYIPVTVYSFMYSKHWVIKAAAPLMYLSHGLGATVYVKHWPQKWWPGSFDYGFHSHVLMHILVFACYNFGYVYLANVQ